ncbi:hypothetical protein FRC09_010328, partial [Ceratobasidium sp. 395]
MSPTKVAPTGSKKSKARAPSNKASGKFNWKAFNAELKSCGIKMSTVDGKWVPVLIAGSKRTPSTALSSLKPKPRSAAHVQEDDDFDDKDLAPLPPVRRKIRLSYAAKPKGSPGRKVGGYNLRQTLQMPQADYAIVYGMVKNMLIGQKGIDMTRPISFQNKLLISHITQKKRMEEVNNADDDDEDEDDGEADASMAFEAPANGGAGKALPKQAKGAASRGEPIEEGSSEDTLVIDITMSSAIDPGEVKDGNDMLWSADGPQVPNESDEDDEPFDITQALTSSPVIPRTKSKTPKAQCPAPPPPSGKLAPKPASKANSEPAPEPGCKPSKPNSELAPKPASNATSKSVSKSTSASSRASAPPELVTPARVNCTKSSKGAT